MFFRVDCNAEIGTGHIMRSLSVAEAVKRQGGGTDFVVADSRSEAILSGRGFDIVTKHFLFVRVAYYLRVMIKKLGFSFLLKMDSFYTFTSSISLK